MKKSFLNSFKDVSYWVDISALYAVSTILILLDVPWYTTTIYAFIASCVTIFLFYRSKIKAHDIDILYKKIRYVLKEAKKKSDVSIIYKALDTELLPVARNMFPEKLYKYYQLNNDENSNQRKFDTLKNNLIWSSIYSEFNDPFECQYMYLEKEDFVAMGFPDDTKKIWDMIMEKIRQRITTICFTQNPNDMPMWAHYANEHKGFCVEYEIIDPSNLYPVFYVENRMKTQGLFIELVYRLFCESATAEEKSSILKHIMLLSAFKDKSWESEREIRAIFINSKDDMNPTGKLYSCKDIGVAPSKIYIGAKCTDENRKLLINIAKLLAIEYEICEVSSGASFSVVSKTKNI